MTSLNQHSFAYAVGEEVEVSLRGTVVKRTDAGTGNEYWITQRLPDGREARQWFKERDVYPADEPARTAAPVGAA